VLFALAISLSLPVSGMAGSPKVVAAPVAPATSNGNGKVTALVPAGLIADAQANPDKIFHVIVQGTKGNSSSTVASDVSGQNGNSKHQFSSISGVAGDLTVKDLLKLARHPHILSITLDAPMVSQAVPVPSITQSVPVASVTPDASMWAATTNIDSLWNTTDLWSGLVLGPAPKAPAIAIIDSGIDSSKVKDFGSRVVASVNFSSLSPTATGDQEGHGTMVAGIAAGASAAYPGAAQNAPIVDLRTADANGQSVTSDVIAAVDWILANKDKYNIKVANFSMAGASTVSFRYDPLDRAVESLWFNGVVVVAASGNQGTGTGPVDMSHAPGNDPFVITVGAVDQQQTSDPSDDTIPTWSAYGSTMDGFSKPDLVAPGRYMVAPVPMNSTIATTVPGRIVAPGYIWMSGTSFAAPVVSGAAAQILARHPDWTPDEVKGALMLTSAYLPNAVGVSAGVGEIDGGTAASLDFTPPNPNEGFDAFVAPDPTTGSPTFNAAAWSSAVQADASWSSAAWSSAAWSSAAWSSASWSSASWSSANFTADTSSAMSSLATFAP
jgi:serine protease AprX